MRKLKLAVYYCKIGLLNTALVLTRATDKYSYRLHKSMCKLSGWLSTAHLHAHKPTLDKPYDMDQEVEDTYQYLYGDQYISDSINDAREREQRQRSTSKHQN